MGDPGNPTDGGTPPEPDPDPDQPGWASPHPPDLRRPRRHPQRLAPAGPDRAHAARWPSAVRGDSPAADRTGGARGGTTPRPHPPGARRRPRPRDRPRAPGAPAWGDPAARPPKKRRLTWLWFLIPLMLVFVAATVVTVVFGVKIFTEPVDATNDYYADLSAGRYEAAYARLCTPAKRAFSESAFVAEPGTGRARRTAASPTTTSTTSSWATTATSTATRSTPPSRGPSTRDGRTFDVAVGLQHEDGEWHVCAIGRR